MTTDSDTQSGAKARVNVRGHIRDLLAFRRLVPARHKRFAAAPAQPLGKDPMNRLAQQLHPESQSLVVAEVRDETATTRTFRLVPDPETGDGPLAYFRAGQYLSLKAEVDGATITRPYSISSAPYQALGPEGFYEITMRKEPDGFLTPHVWAHWGPGTRVRASGPCGQFYHEPLRDGRRIVGLAGGSGITPFCSMAREIVDGEMDAELLLLYGSSDEDDIVYYELFKELEARAAGRVRVVHVLSCDEVTLPGCEQGFITAGTIAKYAEVDHSTFFLCGPQAMYQFVENELATFGLPRRRVRREVYGIPKDVRDAPGYPQATAGETFELTVQIGGTRAQIPARADETVLVAMERAGLAPPSQCRSGECGFCRSRLVRGDVYVLPDSDGRRAADKQFGYIHPCASYPLADLETAVPRDV
jgi:ferredoxin-NADP reductase